MPLGNADKIQSFSDHDHQQAGMRYDDNCVFHDRMRYVGHRNCRSVVGVWLRSETSQRRYYMIMRDFSRMMSDGNVVDGVIESDWTGTKKGRQLAIIPADLVGWEKVDGGWHNAYENFS